MNIEILKKHKYTNARVLNIKTPHGEFTTPAFMPVGTKAAVNSISPSDLKKTGSQIILGGNTYHMLCTPGMDIIKNAGGMHKFMSWDGPMLTDSGGFQVFSLSKNSNICKINENGAKFKHPNTGQIIELSPESSIKAQKIIGADIIMAFDQCTPDIDDKSIVQDALNRTHRWLKESILCHSQNKNSVYGYKQALFGIIQGGFFKEYRLQSADFVLNQDLDGIAIGGEAIGFDMNKTNQIIEWLIDLLPEDKPRYTMGVGLKPSDLLEVTQRGIDIFDCVAPTRNARHGSLYHGHIIEKNNWLEFSSEYKQERLNISKSIFAKDNRPIMDNCECYTCKNHSRAYLHYLFKSKSINYNNLATMHNIQLMNHVCSEIRNKIIDLSS